MPNTVRRVSYVLHSKSNTEPHTHVHSISIATPIFSMEQRWQNQQQQRQAMYTEPHTIAHNNSSEYGIT